MCKDGRLCGRRGNRLESDRKPQPTLTDEERTFLRMVRDTYAMQDDDEVCGMISASISGLLERTK
jgi:hypothetical protein